MWLPHCWNQFPEEFMRLAMMELRKIGGNFVHPKFATLTATGYAASITDHIALDHAAF
jgi:hypothetical protein